MRKALDTARRFLSNFYHTHMMEPRWVKFRREVKNSYEVIYSDTNENEISELCDLYGSDKGSTASKTHAYSDFYSDFFSSQKLSIKSVFECGIGSINPSIPFNMGINGRPGASLRVWRDYFPMAQVYGADIDETILFTEDRITTAYVDQTNPESINSMWNEFKIDSVDVIIDDGLHQALAAITLFESSIEKLRIGGLYVIEDLDHENLNTLRLHFKGSKHKFRYIRFDNYEFGPKGGFLAFLIKGN
jgi:hypothetical protein